jgi:hypothetical protein
MRLSLLALFLCITLLPDCRVCASPLFVYVNDSDSRRLAASPCRASAACRVVSVQSDVQTDPADVLSVPLESGGALSLTRQYLEDTDTAQTHRSRSDIKAGLARAKAKGRAAPVAFFSALGPTAILVMGTLGVTANIPTPTGFLHLSPCLGGSALVPNCHTLSTVLTSDVAQFDVGADVIYLGGDELPQPSPTSAPGGGSNSTSTDSVLLSTQEDDGNSSSPNAMDPAAPSSGEDARGDFLCANGVLSSDGLFCCPNSCNQCSDSACDANTPWCCPGKASKDRTCDALVSPCSMLVLQSVLVVYTTDVQAQVADINALAALAVSETNAGYLNSRIPIRMTLQDTVLTTTVADDFDSYTMLMNFRGYDRQGANMAVLLSEGLSACGRGFIDCARYLSESCAYAVVKRSCATGYYSFGHEIGHIQGADHNVEASTSPSRFLDNHGYIIRSGECAPASERG